ncbi:hypothetical protein AFUB_076940 [Aspergillus fumigatus A1163]|uniref:Uncharacterized protein n=1 Tax=Aspergillus fumigatus (strain CBS 144.89 / FGSC A1163 / CEA10) TaxID=451804 RepID=B0Y8D3_ASPFC|nr:hypothetical protein AFUB_076940 [Aspergillus fumigatus A1163]
MEEKLAWSVLSTIDQPRNVSQSRQKRVQKSEQILRNVHGSELDNKKDFGSPQKPIELSTVTRRRGESKLAAGQIPGHHGNLRHAGREEHELIFSAAAKQWAAATSSKTCC